jgi:flagellar basal body-associated protein FliL
MKKKPMIAVIALLLVVVLAGGGYYFLVIKKQQDAAAEKKNPTYYTFELKDSFVTNVKDSDKLFKATIILVLDKDKMDTELTAKLPVIRDTILFQLRDLTEDDIGSSTVEGTLRKSIPAAVNKALGITDVKSVYFSDFVMQ